MNRRAHRTLSLLLLVGVVALGVSFATEARADMTKKVIKAFKGQILVTEDPLPGGGTDKETIAAFKAAKRKSVKGEPNSEEVTTWTFHYTAFLKKTGFSSLTMEFHSDGRYVADRGLEGVDPKDPVLEGDISITEDDGPAKGKKYTLKLVGTKGGKEVVVATTTLVME